jgi:oligosaccharide 4-alpha-D-glucosyltransferase
MSLSGIPYIHSDAGGFAMGQKDPELYTRWLQFASFTPVFRPHGTALGDADPNVQHIESEPVFYPEPYKSIVRDLIQLRYDLAPYNYTLAFEQQQWGRPLMRPMFYHYPEDTACYSAVDQYLWGENILVAPVFDQKAIEKTVYLPKGPWYHYAENKLLQGGRWMNVPAGIEDIPFFIRAGAFIPKVMGLKNLEDYSTKELEVMYVPAAHATSYTLFDDDGRTAGSIQNKQYELLQFSGKSTAAQITISVKTNGGNFNGRPAGRNISFVIPALERSPGSVTVNGKAVNTFSFDEEGRILRLKVAFNNQPLKVEIDY